MSLFTKIAAKSFPVLATLAVSTGLFVWGKWVLRQDPFEDFRRQPELDQNVGIRLNGVKLWNYHGSQIQTSATCDRIDVDPQRQHLTLANITEGWTHTDKGDVQFTAAAARWNDASQSLDVDQGARVYGKNFDLTTNAFLLDKADGILKVPGKLSGRLYDGTVTAASLRYNLDKGNYAIDKPDWVGTVSMDQGDKTQKDKPTRWHISSEDTVTHENSQEVWPNAVAATTDGETILKADKVVRDTKTDIITATGNVKYFSTKLNMTCDMAVVDRKIKKAVFTGKVHCYFKGEEEQKAKVEIVEIAPFRPMVPDEIAAARPPAPQTDEDKQITEELRSGKNARKYPVTAQAGKIEYWYAKGDRHAEITGDPQARQDFPKGHWRHVGTLKAHYDGEQERLRLYGDPSKKQVRIRTSSDEDLKATWFEVSTKDSDEQDWKARGLDGVVNTESDDESPSTSPAATSGKPIENPKPQPLQGHIGG